MFNVSIKVNYQNLLDIKNLIQLKSPGYFEQSQDRSPGITWTIERANMESLIKKIVNRVVGRVGKDSKQAFSFTMNVNEYATLDRLFQVTDCYEMDGNEPWIHVVAWGIRNEVEPKIELERNRMIARIEMSKI